MQAVPTPEDPTLAQAISGGDYIEILLAQRREIVETLPDVRGAAKAALHRQLTLISKEIEAIRVNHSGRRLHVGRTTHQPDG